MNPGGALEASRQGILTWFNQILPALLPFTILSSVFIKSNFMQSIPMRHPNLLAVVITLVCGFFFGFPIGAKLSSDFYAQKLLSRRQATILCVCANNFSFMYTFGYVLPTLFEGQDLQLRTCVILYGIPLVSAFLLLVLCEFADHRRLSANRTSSASTCLPHDCDILTATELHPPHQDIKTTPRFQLDMQIIDAGIISGFETLIKICGYIVLFSLIAHIAAGSLLLGNLEITNGIQILSETAMQPPYKFICAIQLLSFGGLSGLAQTASIIGATGLSVLSYCLGKVILSLLLTLCASVCMFGC